MTAKEVLEHVEICRREELEYSKTHPVYFIEKYVRIESREEQGTTIPFKLWDAQRDAVKSILEHKFNILLKARQLGITWLVLSIAAHEMMFKEGALVIGLSRTEEEAKELVRRLGLIFSTMGEFVAQKPCEGMYTVKVNAMSVAVKKHGGKESVFKVFCSTPAAARSFTADLLILDEWAYQEYAEEIWTSAFPTINRPTGGRVIGLSTMRLGGLFERIWREEGLFNRIFLPWNADPARNEEWYEKTRETLGELTMQEYPATPEEALTAPGGRFFDEFRTNIHVKEYFPIPAHWRRYHAIDYGLDMLASYWGAVDPEGTMWIYREVYEPELIIPAAAEAMRTAEDDDNIYARYAPPDIFGRSRETGVTRAEAFSKHGFSFMRASADREAGWSNLHDWLMPYTDAEGQTAARLYIMKSCPNLIRTISTIQRDRKRANDCATDPHELTHAPDALRYMMMARPAPETKPERLKEYDEAESVLNYGRAYFDDEEDEETWL